MELTTRDDERRIALAAGQVHRGVEGAAGSPTTAPTATATAPRPTTLDHCGLGPLATAQLTAPTNRPKTSVNGTMTTIDTCVASVMARIATSQADAAVTTVNS